jgi:hypothetical protein
VRLPNGLRITWWVVVTSVITWFLAKRYPDLVAGHASALDMLVVVVWIALMLAPVFGELKLFGMSFKHQVEALKDDLKAEFWSIRSEVRTAVDARTSLSQQFHFPPPDSQLPDLEEQIKRIVAKALESNGQHNGAAVSTEIAVSADVRLLFATRYALERELRRVWDSRVPKKAGLSPIKQRFFPIGKMVTDLRDSGVLDPYLANAIQEVYAVCSPAIHGAPVSEAQLRFVRDTGLHLVNVLAVIQ